MDTDSMAATLNRKEQSLLMQVRDSLKDLSLVSAATAIDKATLFNAARKLQDYGLIRLVIEPKVKYVLTENGKRYMHEGLPEYMIVRELSGNAMSTYVELKGILRPDELSAGIGQLKKVGALEETAGRFSVNAAKAEGILEKNALLERVYRGEDVPEGDDLKDLIKRKIIERVVTQDEKVEINESGREVLKSPKFGIELIDKLTPDTIKDWRGKEFRRYDLDARPPAPLAGKKHITKQFISQIKDVLVPMGFEEMESNYVESAFWNFDVMMFKQDHPDRDIQDTVYVNGGKARIPAKLLEEVKEVYEDGFSAGKDDRSIGYGRKFDTDKSRALIMRGHTTATTFRYIHEHIAKAKDKPAKYFSVSRVFRNETADASHLPEFYQIEGIVYDDDLTVASLISFVRDFYSGIGINEIRFKPTYNPYTEPSLEIQAFSRSRKMWVEVGNSGVFRPETLRPFGITKNIIAWGFGLERALAMRLGINDIRSVYGALTDLDLLRDTEPRKLMKRFD